jgi:hypothetical protein
MASSISDVPCCCPNRRTTGSRADRLAGLIRAPCQLRLQEVPPHGIRRARTAGRTTPAGWTGSDEHLLARASTWAARSCSTRTWSRRSDTRSCGEAINGVSAIHRRWPRGDADGRRVARHGPAHADVVQALQQRVEILGARRQQVHPDLRLLADVHPGIEETVERRERQVLLQDAIGLAGGLGDAGLEVGNPAHDVVRGSHRTRRRLDGAEPRDRVLRLGCDLRDRYRPRATVDTASNGSVVVAGRRRGHGRAVRRTTTSPPLHPIGPMLPEADRFPAARVAPPCRSRHVVRATGGSARHLPPPWAGCAATVAARDCRRTRAWRELAPSRCRSTRPAPQFDRCLAEASEHHGRIDHVCSASARWC